MGTCGGGNTGPVCNGDDNAWTCCISAGPTCDGSTNAWSCCSSTNKCGEGEGDCDSDSECQSGLVCGTDNCQSFIPGAHYQADCCAKPAVATNCDGSSSAWSCCSANSKCGHGEGDCDSDNECQSGLKCGKDNCRDFHSGAAAAADCCIPSSRVLKGKARADFMDAKDESGDRQNESEIEEDEDQI